MYTKSTNGFLLYPRYQHKYVNTYNLHSQPIRTQKDSPQNIGIIPYLSLRCFWEQRKDLIQSERGGIKKRTKSSEINGNIERNKQINKNRAAGELTRLYFRGKREGTGRKRINNKKYKRKKNGNMTLVACDAVSRTWRRRTCAASRRMFADDKQQGGGRVRHGLDLHFLGS